MGVSGFFISWATCFAISRQAFSLSLFANFIALSSSSSIIRLYEFTNSANSLGGFVSVILLSP